MRIIWADRWPEGEEPWRQGQQLERRRPAHRQTNCQLACLVWNDAGQTCNSWRELRVLTFYQMKWLLKILMQFPARSTFEKQWQWYCNTVENYISVCMRASSSSCVAYESPRPLRPRLFWHHFIKRVQLGRRPSMMTITQLAKLVAPILIDGV